MRKIQFNRRGFTLVELVLTMGLLLLVLQVVYSIFFVGHKSYVISTNTGFAQQGVRLGNLFISDELEYATGLDVDDATDFMTDYYTLEYDSIVEKLMWRKYEPGDLIDDPDNKIEEKNVTGIWDEIIVSNNEPGKLSVTMEKTEQQGSDSSDYKLNFDIELLNDSSLLTNKEWDLMNGDILYYTKNETRSFGSVNIDWKNEELSGGNSNYLSWGEGEDNVIITVDGENISYDNVNKGYVVGNSNGNKDLIIYYTLSYSNADTDDEGGTTVTVNGETDGFNHNYNTSTKIGTITGSHTKNNSLEYILITVNRNNTTDIIYKSIKLLAK